MLQIPGIRATQSRLGTVPNLWRASELAGLHGGIKADGIESGFPALDEALFDRGWPQGGLVELLLDEPGVGELSLLGPALASISTSEERLIAWIAPPFVPYPPALGAAGIDVSKVLMVHPDNHADALWTFEQVLKTGACSALLGWLAERELKFTEIRRLQFAARQGRTWASLFRPATAAANASPAELRLRLWPRQRVSRSATRRGGLRLDLVKRRGGWPLSGIEIDFDADSSLPRPAPPIPDGRPCSG
ncbi:MAG: translesion DNA synthesis-associated protein ImuA [Gammaproteobacteria bacterium]|nr:translesion DNA synthesis-associated protein ImuA [Gammaproteobacteria bacterium]MDE0440651.1 translesion DNA synthesis-associated protein ImuA [Gammaproteobacteria bacterium]